MQLDGDVSIGRCFGSEIDTVMTVSNVIDSLERQAVDDVGVEEQDYSWYIIHIGKHSRHWVTIDESSPIYSELRQYHRAWRPEKT